MFFSVELILHPKGEIPYSFIIRKVVFMEFLNIHEYRCYFQIWLRVASIPLIFGTGVKCEKYDRNLVHNCIGYI